MTTPFSRLSARDSSKHWNVVIETPKGHRNKFKYDEKAGLFTLSGILPCGAVFPYDFGFIPATLGEDGDPVDVLLLMDEAAFAGCVVPARLIGVIEAKQTEDGKTERNDRIIAIPADSQDHKDVHAMKNLSTTMIDEIEHFFISYNQAKGKKFKPIGRFGPNRAESLARQGMHAYKKKQAGKK